jgi:hypothetical protein
VDILQKPWDLESKPNSCFLLEYHFIDIEMMRRNCSLFFPRKVHFCKNIAGVMSSIGTAACQLSKWKSFYRFVKAFLLHNSNKYTSGSFSFDAVGKKHNNLELHKEVKTKEHGWILCGDFSL